MKRSIKKFVNLISPNISRSFRNYRITKLLKRSAQISSSGDKFWGMQNFYTYEPEIFSALSRIISGSNVFINVGANHGIYCIKFAPLVEKIYAFEALSTNQAFIYKNIKENNLREKISVFPVAAGAGQSLTTFYGATSGGSLLKGWNQQIDSGVDIPLFSLDFLLLSNLKGTTPLFLIDVEGAEFEVIKGAVAIIENIPEAIFCIEIPCREFMPEEKFNPSFLSIFEFFDVREFLAYEIVKDGSLIKINMEQAGRYFEDQRYEGIMAVFSKSPIAL